MSKDKKAIEDCKHVCELKLRLCRQRAVFGCMAMLFDDEFSPEEFKEKLEEKFDECDREYEACLRACES